MKWGKGVIKKGKKVPKWNKYYLDACRAKRNLPSAKLLSGYCVQCASMYMYLYLQDTKY